MQRIGGIGPKVLVLHATGFLGDMYRPLAAALAASFDVYTLDFPGHGICISEPPKVTALAAAQYIVDTVDANGLRNCLALGHSAGGAFALLASTLSPGLFSAIYCFEAVAATPLSHNYMRIGKESGSLKTAGQLLSTMARQRRHRFSSKQEALQRLVQKPPYAGMHPESVKLYVQHGTRERAEAASGEGQRRQQQQAQHSGIELVCDPNTEAAYYEALDPPPAILGRLITCPVMLAVAGNGSNGAYRQHDAVKQWLLENPPSSGQPSQISGDNSSSSQDPLHGGLVVLNEELASSIPAQFASIPGVSHFGPLERPELIAESCRIFFSTVVGHKQHGSTLMRSRM